MKRNGSVTAGDITTRGVTTTTATAVAANATGRCWKEPFNVRPKLVGQVGHVARGDAEAL